MGLVFDHFWGHVLKGAAEGISWLGNFGLHTPAEVADFDDVALLDEDILRLDVTMDKTLFVHVVDAGADLDEEVESHVLVEMLLLANQKEEIALACKLKSEVDGLLVFERGVETAQVFVVQVLLDGDFSDESFLYLLAGE